MGAALAGVFCGVLLVNLLDCGTSMVSGVEVVVMMISTVENVWRGAGGKLTEQRWSPSSYCGSAQTSWRVCKVYMQVASC